MRGLISCSKSLNQLCGYSTDDCVRLYILGNNCASSYDGILADSHTRKNRSTSTYPTVVFQHDWFTRYYLMFLWIVVI
jgi:hypothetical protein